MFKIENSTIHCSRGDSGTISLKLPYTDQNDYIKYLDTNDVVYWYDLSNKKLYDANYNESSVSLNTLTEQFYEFQPGDVIKFNVYERKGYDQNPLMTKTVVVNTASFTVDINLSETNTTFGPIVNKETIYWYDITLNDDLTIVCYNEEGAKEFIMYPAKGSEE